MREPEDGKGTIRTMECPKCGRRGLRFIKGENAVGEWERQGALLGKERDIPADVSPDATVMFCSEECGYVEYGDIDWTGFSSRAVKLDPSSASMGAF
jgi:endogenous inhibitor of DNA gyrase (YacG/DUF329 family)